MQLHAFGSDRRGDGTASAIPSSASPFAALRPSRALAVGGMATAVVAMAALVATSSLAAARPAPESFADLAARVSPAVVNISVVQEAGPRQAERAMPETPFGPDHPFNEFFERFFGDRMPQGAPGQDGARPEVRGVGSGFIIDAEGYVVTNDHVVGEAREITVTLADGASYEAELIGSDDKTDLALLKIEPDEPLPTVSFGDSDAMRPGDWVMAVGNPFGLGGTVTAGIVSARGRDLPGGTLIDFLQIDAPINRGNSGGPAFDMSGAVIGVNTAIFSPTGGSIGIGFAIPSNLAEMVIADLRDDGEVERGWLGVRIQQVTPDIAEGFGLDEPRGALVAAVEPDSPAAAAGLKAGDVILTWGDEPVEKMTDLPRLVGFTPAEAERRVTVWRDGREETLAVVTGRLAAEASAPGGEAERPADPVRLADSGVSVADLSSELRRQFGIDAAVSGAVIVAIAPDSDAAGQGLRVGDVITAIGQEPVETARDAEARIAALREAGRPVVTVMASRDGVESFFALRLEEA